MTLYRRILAIEDRLEFKQPLENAIQNATAFLENASYNIASSLSESQFILNEWFDEDFENKAGSWQLKPNREVRLDAILDIYMEANKGQGDTRPATGIVKDVIMEQYFTQGGVICFRSGFADNAKQHVIDGNAKYSKTLFGYSQKGTEVPINDIANFIVSHDINVNPTYKAALSNSRLGQGDFNLLIKGLKERAAKKV